MSDNKFFKSMDYTLGKIAGKQLMHLSKMIENDEPLSLDNVKRLEVFAQILRDLREGQQ